VGGSCRAAYQPNKPPKRERNRESIGPSETGFSCTRRLVTVPCVSSVATPVRSGGVVGLEGATVLTAVGSGEARGDGLGLGLGLGAGVTRFDGLGDAVGSGVAVGAIVATGRTVAGGIGFAVGFGVGATTGSGVGATGAGVGATGAGVVTGVGVGTLTPHGMEKSTA
jgi:hypothetical protein